MPSFCEIFDNHVRSISEIAITSRKPHPSASNAYLVVPANSGKLAGRIYAAMKHAIAANNCSTFAALNEIGREVRPESLFDMDQSRCDVY